MPGAIERLLARALPHLPDAWVAALAGPPTPVRGRVLDPRLRLVARASERQTPLHRLTPAEARAAASEGLALAAARPRPMQRVERRALPGPAAPIPVRVYHPPGLAGARPLVLYFHQGGCVIGDLDWCEAFATVLAETARCPVMSVGYRKGPEHRFPAAQEDALAAWRWAREHAGEVGGDPGRLVVAGDSAGGGLAAMLCHAARREGAPQPLAQVLVYPWLDARCDSASYRDFGDGWPLSRALMDWFASHYLRGDADRDDPRMSPLRETDFAGLAPAIVATAGFDPLCDEGEAYAAALEKAGVPVRFRCYEHLCHSFTSLSGAVPAAREALDEIARDLERAVTGAWP
jgi:acetyl esterase/lipase